MAKKHKIKARGWHHPGKVIKRNKEGKCRLCKKEVNNLEEHMKSVHRGK